MRHVKLFEDVKGDFKVWEEPVPGASYVLGADVALARDTWKNTGSKGVDGDSSTIIILRRDQFRLVQVFQGRSRMEAGMFGEIIAAWGTHYNKALINIERNLADAPFASLSRAGYPLERLYVQPETLSSLGGVGSRYFTTKSHANSKYLLDTLIDYLTTFTSEGGAKLVLRSSELMAELRKISKDATGRMESTNGKDLAVALMMAVVADSTTPAEFVPLPPAAKPPKPPWNVDQDEWKREHGIKDKVAWNPNQAAGWTTGGTDLPEFVEWGPQGAD